MLKRFKKMFTMLFALLTIISHTGQEITFACVINYLEFYSLEEFLDAYIAAHEGRISPDLEIARRTEHSNFALLEEIHLIKNLPEKFRLDEISVGRQLVSIAYVAIAEDAGETRINATENNKYFTLRVTRWTYEDLKHRGYDSPLDDIMSQFGFAEEDLIEGQYLYYERSNTLHWAQDSNLFTLRMPMVLRNIDDALGLTDASNLRLVVENSVYDMIELANTVSVDLRDDNNIVAWRAGDFTMFDALLGRAQYKHESTATAEPEQTTSYHEEDTPQQSEIELPVVVAPTLLFTVGSNNFLHNGTVKQAESAPFISQERTMIPLRIIAEALNAEVDWDSATRTVIITGRGETINLIVDVPLPGDMGTPVIVNGSTSVPVRYVSETLGATVRWDGENKAVYIYGT